MRKGSEDLLPCVVGFLGQETPFACAVVECSLQRISDFSGKSFLSLLLPDVTVTAAAVQTVDA
jgi:hypothetical protein